MSMTSKPSEPPAPGDVQTPETQEEEAARQEETVLIPGRRDEEEEVFEDASEDGEVFIRRQEEPRPPVRQLYHSPPTRPLVSTQPHMKPEDYDGTSDWSEYKIYFDQLAELYNWEEERKAMILGICLKGEARVVLASLNQAQRRSYLALTTALAQSFSPKELVHLYQAELKARKKRADESMANLGRDIAKLVRLAYPAADPATREVIGINAFLEALPGPASEMKLHVIKGRPRSLQEAVAHATEVDAVIEAESRRTSRRRGDVRMVGTGEEDELVTQVKELKESLAQVKGELKDAQRRAKGQGSGKRPPGDVVCYGCGEKGHIRRNCPKSKGEESRKKGQGNESRRLEK